jgi:glycosyltransferase involved in cell wall biosynthesis
MRILHVETGQNLYGGALQVEYLMKGLRQHDCENILVCRPNSQIAASARPYAVIYELPMLGELDPLFALRLRQVIRKSRPDIVHVHSRRGADLWSPLAAWRTRSCLILTRRVDNPELPWLARFKYRHYHRVITISEAIRRVMLKERVPAHKLVCVPSAVDAQHDTRGCQKEWFWSQFSLQPDHKVIGVIAQLIARKGHQHLIKAIPAIVRRYPNTVFLFLGQGPLRAKLHKLCCRQKIEKYVHFAGFRPDLEKILGCLDIVVHPAEMEGLGVALLQSAAAGLPIVATRVGGIPEIVQDGINGYLVDVSDIQTLSARTLELLQDPVMARRLGKAGRLIVTAKFSIDAMVSGNLRVYRDVMPYWRDRMP